MWIVWDGEYAQMINKEQTDKQTLLFSTSKKSCTHSNRFKVKQSEYKVKDHLDEIRASEMFQKLLSAPLNINIK